MGDNVLLNLLHDILHHSCAFFSRTLDSFPFTESTVMCVCVCGGRESERRRSSVEGRRGEWKGNTGGRRGLEEGRGEGKGEGVEEGEVGGAGAKSRGRGEQGGKAAQKGERPHVLVCVNTTQTRMISSKQTNTVLETVLKR